MKDPRPAAAGADGKNRKISPAQIRARLAERRAARPPSAIASRNFSSLTAAILFLLVAACAYFFCSCRSERASPL